jgi:hypothetical protein
MNAADLYSKTLQGYSSILPVLKVSLSQYCKEHKVNYRELRHWMRENSIPVPQSEYFGDAAPPFGDTDPLFGVFIQRTKSLTKLQFFS